MIFFMLSDMSRWLVLWFSLVICFFPSLVLALTNNHDETTRPEATSLLWYFVRPTTDRSSELASRLSHPAFMRMDCVA